MIRDGSRDRHDRAGCVHDRHGNGREGGTKMKQVWMLNHHAAEPNGTGGVRHFSLAKGMLSHGWRATIIVASNIANGTR